jgi:hypothetical protein
MKHMGETKGAFASHPAPVPAMGACEDGAHSFVPPFRAAKGTKQ